MEQLSNNPTEVEDVHYGSICGKVLHVDLTNQKTEIVYLSKKIYDLLIGGKGLGIYFLLKIPKGADPLGEQNDLIFVTGPLTGTLAPCSNKWGVVTKGPASGGFLDSYSSGIFGPNMKFAGFDAIIIHGKANQNQVLAISDDNVRFFDSQKLQLTGLSPYETESRLKKRFGDEFACVSIGLAGEQLSPIAGIFTEQRCAGRGGAGAVMGSKNLKAIIIRGNHSISLNNPEEFRTAAWVARRYIRSGEITVRAMPKYGTANIVNAINELHVFPTNNFQKGHFDYAEAINGESFRENYWNAFKDPKKMSGNIACYACPISCSKIAYVQQQPGANNPVFPETIPELNNLVVIDGPEYETIFALGSNIGNPDQDVLLKTNYLCDYYGIDTISTGVIIGCVMELFEKKILTEQDLDGIRANWGSGRAILDLTRKIGKMEGCGSILGKGVKEIAKHWPQASDYIMHVKGLELPGYDPRNARGMGLCYAVSDRGACHLHAFTASVEVLGNAGGSDPYDLGPKKMELFLNLQAESTFIDSAVLCFFTLNGMQIKEVISLLNAAVDEKFCASSNFVKTVAQRILTLTRLFNYREGLTAIDDMLPRRILKVSHVEGPGKGKTIENFEAVLQSYYSAMQWDKDGSPTKELLKELQINDL
jgi:aldehyde:ferredoxin oxidoreductase